MQCICLHLRYISEWLPRRWLEKTQGKNFLHCSRRNDGISKRRTFVQKQKLRDEESISDVEKVCQSGTLLDLQWSRRENNEEKSNTSKKRTPIVLEPPKDEEDRKRTLEYAIACPPAHCVSKRRTEKKRKESGLVENKMKVQKSRCPS